MAKISQLPPAGPLSGSEPVPVVQEGETRGAVIGEVIASITAAAETARDVALTQGPYHPNVAAGEAATTNGQEFAVAPGNGTISFYRRTGGGSALIFEGASKALIDQAQSAIDGVRGPWPVGAVGNGATNDKAAIDAVNIVGQEVDLMGKDYAYTGTVDLSKARFRNGRIISSTMGTLDFRQTLILFSKVISVGAAGTIKRGEHVMPYLRQLRIVGTVEVQTLELNTPNDATGSMAFNVADMWHPDMSRIYWRGMMVPLIPAASAMPGLNEPNLALAKAADYALLLSRFSASMYFTGNDDLSGGVGISAVGGFNAENILLDDHTRYNTSVNWLGSHANKTKGGGRVSLINCATIGGVWTLTLIDVQVYFGGDKVLLTYPISGGAFFAEGCDFYKTGTTELHIYHPKVTPNSNLPQTGFTAKNCDFLFEPNGADANKVFIVGPFLHGLYLTDCTGQIPDVSFDGVTQPRTQVGGRMDYGRPKVRNADPANTALTVGATQPGIIGNPVSRALFFVSKGGKALYRGVDVAASICNYYFVEESGGQNICGLNAKEDIADCKASVKAYSAMASTGNIHRPNISAPRAGSIDGAEVLYNSAIHLYDNMGISPDLAPNALVKGNIISTP